MFNRSVTLAALIAYLMRSAENSFPLVLHKNCSRECSVSEMTGVGGIHRKPAYFAIQTQSGTHALR